MRISFCLCLPLAHGTPENGGCLSRGSAQVGPGGRGRVALRASHDDPPRPGVCPPPQARPRKAGVSSSPRGDRLRNPTVWGTAVAAPGFGARFLHWGAWAPPARAAALLGRVSLASCGCGRDGSRQTSPAFPGNSRHAALWSAARVTAAGSRPAPGCRTGRGWLAGVGGTGRGERALPFHGP